MSVNEDFLRDLLGLGTPVFLAGLDRGGSRLVCHVPAGHDLSGFKELARRFREAKELPEVAVKAHKLKKLAFPRSLEHWLKRFDVEEIIHDPTMIVERGRLLILAAKACRAAFGHAVLQVTFEPATRTMFVRVKDVKDALELQNRVSATVTGVFRGEGPAANTGDWCATVRTVSQLPIRPLIPVDSKSATTWRNLPDLIRKWRLSGLALAISLVSLPAAAHTDNAYGNMPSERQISATAPADFGVLLGLSVFSDGTTSIVASRFISSGLDLYFAEGENVSKRWQFAQDDRRRRRDPEEVGQIGGGGGGGGGAGPGS